MLNAGSNPERTARGHWLTPGLAVPTTFALLRSHPGRAWIEGQTIPTVSVNAPRRPARGPTMLARLLTDAGFAGCTPVVDQDGRPKRRQTNLRPPLIGRRERVSVYRRLDLRAPQFQHPFAMADAALPPQRQPPEPATEEDVIARDRIETQRIAGGIVLQRYVKLVACHPHNPARENLGDEDVAGLRVARHPGRADQPRSNYLRRPGRRIEPQQPPGRLGLGEEIRAEFENIKLLAARPGFHRHDINRRRQAADEGAAAARLRAGPAHFGLPRREGEARQQRDQQL